MKPHFLLALGALLLAPAAFAIIDTNNNGVSDLWEKRFNAGVLFPASFDPEADSDADGWTNAQEAAAGTNPFDPNPPDGLIRPDIVHTPAVFGPPDGNGIPVVVTPEAVTVTWPTIVGKHYTLLFSPDLTEGSWIRVGAPFIGNGNDPVYGFEVNDSDKRFWRVAATDTDTDGDGLTDAEEFEIGTNSILTDADSDGIDDYLEYAAGFSPNNDDQNSNGSRDGWDDFDGDGYSNMEELAAGTDPYNPASRPDGIATDTLVVRNYTVTATYRGACGSKRFAFQELFREAGQGDELSYRPSYYLKSEQKLNQDQDVKEDSFIRVGNISMDYFDTRQKGEDSSYITEWSRQGPAFSSSAAVNYFPSETNSNGYAIQIQARTMDDGVQVATTNNNYTYTYNQQNNPESQTSEETGTFFTFPQFMKIPGSFHPSKELEILEVSENSPTAYKTYESYSGTYTHQGALVGISYSSIQRWNASSSSTVLSSEYTDGMLEADVDEALQTIADSGTNGGYGNSPIAGNENLAPRGFADFGRSRDHTDVLKQDAAYHLTAVPTTAGVKKIVFIWPEVHVSDATDDADPVQQAPKLKIIRTEKLSSSGFPVGQPVQTASFQLPHPENPGFINLAAASSLECPDVLRVSYSPVGSFAPAPPLAALSFHVDRIYQDLTVTLESAGNADIKLWSLTDGTFTEVSLPYTLKREEKAGRISKPASFLIQGITTGNNVLSLKQAGQQIAFKPLKVIDLDLDADSDNSGTVDRSLSEDQVENVGEAPGKVLVYTGEADADSDTVLNRDDMDDAGSFTPIELKLDNLGETERIVFHFSQAGIGTQRNSGSLRLWKKDGTQARSEDDLLSSGGYGYSVDDLGLSAGGELTLYVELANPASVEQLISISGGGIEDSIKLSPISVERLSRDKYLAGSIFIPKGWDNLEIEFLHTASQENLGRYGNLTGGGTTKIYDSVDDVMSDADIASGSQPVTQKVWFVRDSGNPRKISYYTCFNAVGAVQIKLFRSSQVVATFDHTLTTAEDFAATIRYVNDWVKGVGFEFSGGGDPPGLTMGALALNGFGDDAIEHLTRAALIPFFNVINQVEGLASAATGLFDGARAGINDDWQFLVLVKNGGVAAGGWAWQQAETELLKWRDDPLKRAGELKEMASRVCKDWVFGNMLEDRPELSTWDGFKNESWKVWKSVQGTAAKGWTVTRNVWKDIVKGLTDWGDDFCNRMMTGAEKAHWDAVPWTTKLDDDINEISRQASYTFGYTFGYLCEQVAVGALSAGTVKIAQVATKGGVHLAANLARRTAANVAARAHFLKRLLNEATQLSDDLVAAYQRGFSLASTGPTGEGMDKCAMHMMQEAADAGRIVWREYVDNIVGKTNIRQFVKQGGNHIIERQFSRLIHILGDEFTEQIGKNFLKVADEFILVKQADNTVDDFFEAFFKAMEGNPSLIKHADDLSVKVGGTSEALSPGAKARLKQVLRDPIPGEPHPEIGNPWRLDDVEDWTVPRPIPSNYWARGNLIELWKFKKAYKAAGFKHHPNATGYDYSSAADDLFVQIKSYSNPDGAATAARDAIDSLLANAPQNGSQLRLHIVHKKGTSSTSLKQAIDDYLNDPILFDEAERARFLPTIFEEFIYP